MESVNSCHFMHHCDSSEEFGFDGHEEQGPAILSCVGGYQLESHGVQLFEQIEGDYFTILGLPLSGLLAQLRQWGVLDQ